MAKLTLGKKSCESNNYAEKQHEVIFGVNDIKNAGKSIKEPDHETENAELEITRTDALTVKELVEMKFLPKKRKIRLIHKECSEYRLLIEEVHIFVNHNITSLS